MFSFLGKKYSNPKNRYSAIVILNQLAALVLVFLFESNRYQN